MKIQRRTLIQFASAGAVLTPFLQGTTLSAADVNELRYVEITAQSVNAVCQPGDWLLADQSIDRFTGDGIYLYPAWGEPRAYRVTVSKTTKVDNRTELEFYSLENGRLLWRQSLHEEDRFAGQVLGHVARDELVALSSKYDALQILTVPMLPELS